MFDEHADEEDADNDEEDPAVDHDAEKLEGLNLSSLKWPPLEYAANDTWAQHY